METVPELLVRFFVFKKGFMEIIVEHSGIKENWSIRISGALNGVVVETCEGKKYVYKSIKEASKDLPGIVSILKDETPRTTEKDLEQEEERINNNG